MKKVQLACTYGEKLSVLIKISLNINTKIATKIKLKNDGFVINNYITKKHLYK
jgi:hypothetical protein